MKQSGNGVPDSLQETLSQETPFFVGLSQKRLGDAVADQFIVKLQSRLQTLSEQPFIGTPSTAVKSVRSILITRQNRLFYRIKDNVIEVINMYDTRSNPKKNPYK